MKVPKAVQVSSGTWFIRMRLGGENINVTDLTERGCVKKAQLAKAEYLAGKRAPKEQAPAKLPTLGEGMKTFIRVKEHVRSPSTIRGYEEIRKLRFPDLQKLSMSDLDRDNCSAAIANALETLSPKTVKNAWAFVKSVLRYHKVEPPQVDTLQVPKKRRPFLDSEEIKIFLGAVKGNPYELPILLALTSMRRSEIMALRWEHIDLAHNRIHVSGAAVMDKNNKLVQRPQNKNDTSDRYIPIMIPELKAVLEAAWQPSGLVVTCNPNTIWSNAKKVCRKAGLPEVGTHGLRHSFASLAVSLQIPEDYTMAIGGWADIQTMRKIYTHISERDMTKYEAAFSGFYKNVN